MNNAARWIVLFLFILASGYIHYKVKTIPDPEWTGDMAGSGPRNARARQIDRSVAGRPAGDFSLPDVSGSMVSRASFAGKPMLINFMTSWCGPCKIELPALNRFAQEHPEIVVIGVDCKEDVETAKRFHAEMKITFPFLIDEDGEVMAEYDVSAYPTTYVIDAEGVIRGRKVGAEHDFDALVRAALSAETPDNSDQPDKPSPANSSPYSPGSR